MFCSKCGAQLAPQAVFCTKCGAPVSPAQTVAPGSPPPGNAAPGAPPQAMLGSAGRYSSLPPYWQEVFQKFEARPGQMQTHWNWPAFFFGPFWYLVKGMPAKGAIYIAVIVVTVGFGLFLAVYAGLYGPWDYYLKETQGKQLW